MSKDDFEDMELSLSEKTLERANIRMNIEALMRDRITANQTDFGNPGLKESGVSLGYTAERSADGKKHILKQAYKKDLTGEMVLEFLRGNEDANKNFRNYYVKKLSQAYKKSTIKWLKEDDPGFILDAEKEVVINEYVQTQVNKCKLLLDDHTNGLSNPILDDLTKFIIGEERVQRRDMVVEYVSGRMYERFLYDRAPKINLASTDDRDPAIFVTSKFFDKFQTLTELTGFKLSPQNNGRIDPSHESLRNVEGFEKVIAACTIGGELDYHASNIGVVPALDDGGNPRSDSEGKPIYNVVKIDHGRSLLVLKEESTIREELAKNIKLFNYSSMKMNISKFKESLEQMANISDDEIDALSGKAILELKRKGMVFSDVDLEQISATQIKQLIKNGIIDPSASEEEKLTMLFSDNFRKRRNVVKDLVKTLEIIEKISPAEEAWKDGAWLNEIKREDPIAWAINHEKKIDGIDPVLWALENGRNIEGQEPLFFAAIESYKIIVQNPDGTEGKLDPIIWAIENGRKIGPDNYEALEFAALSQVEMPLRKLDGTEENVPAIIWALNNDKKIGDKNPIIWAIDNGVEIDGQEPLKYAALNNLQILVRGSDGVMHKKDPILWALENAKKIEGQDPILFARANNINVEIPNTRVSALKAALQRGSQVVASKHVNVVGAGVATGKSR